MQSTTDAHEETLDRLTGAWRIFQLRRGHRFSTDDLATAWRAALARPDARRLLDLGCGIGSVGLSTLAHMHADATLVGIEAQEVSVDLARRTVALNGLGARVEIRRGDLRDPAMLPDAGCFDLVTGSPPYIPPDKGVHSPHPQRAACRMELRGSVFDYCEAARRALAPGGRFAFVMSAVDPRTDEAPPANGLAVLERFVLVFRAGRPFRIAVLVCAREEDGPFPPTAHRELLVRGDDGEWTEDYHAFRAAMGLPVPSGMG